MLSSLDDHLDDSSNRRTFLKTMGNLLGLTTVTTLFGDATLQQVEAATQRLVDRSPQDVARDEPFWFTIQQAFSVTHRVINLNNGWVCPSPRSVTEALERYLWQNEENPVEMERTLWRWIDVVRSQLAHLFGCDAEEVAIVRNATEALQTVLLGVPLHPGDEVLTTTFDYHAMLKGLAQRSAREGIVVKKLVIPTRPRSLDDLLQMIEHGITAHTRLILISHPVSVTGQLFPVKAICEFAHQRGIEVVVDGAQGFGHLAFTQADLGCDYFGASLHKWLLAPKGLGLLYVRKEKIANLWPLFPADKGLKEDIRKFEAVGTRPIPPILALPEAIAFHQGMDARRKEARLRYLTQYWTERLQRVPNVELYTSVAPEMSCGLASFGVRGVHPEALSVYLLQQHRIITLSLHNEGIAGLRITPNVYTTLSELDYFCEVIEEVATKGLPKPYSEFRYDPPRNRNEDL